MGQTEVSGREIVPIEVDYKTEGREIHAMLREYTESRQAHARDAVERVASEFVLKLLKKWLFSSLAAFASTLDKHRSSLGKARDVCLSHCSSWIPGQVSARNQLPSRYVQIIRSLHAQRPRLELARMRF